MFCRWDSLLDGSAVLAVHGTPKARPVYLSSEIEPEPQPQPQPEPEPQP